MSESLADTFKNNCLPPSACMDPSNGSLVISIPPKSIDSKVPSQSSNTGKPSSGFVNLRSAQIVDGVEQVSVHLHMCVCVREMENETHNIFWPQADDWHLCRLVVHARIHSLGLVTLEFLLWIGDLLYLEVSHIL